MAEKPRDRRPVKAGGVKGGAGKPPRKGRAGEPRAKPAAERMVRKQVLLTVAQSRWLRRRAAETGLAESEIVRRGIDMALEAGPQDDADWKAAWRRAAGVWKDRDDLRALDTARREARKLRQRRLSTRMEAD